MPNKIATLDWNDTFLGADHLKASFPDCEVVFGTEEDDDTKPPYRLVVRQILDSNCTQL